MICCTSDVNPPTRLRGYDGPRQPLFVLISRQLLSKEVTKNTKFDSIGVETPSCLAFFVVKINFFDCLRFMEK